MASMCNSDARSEARMPQVAANPAPGPARATSGLKPRPTARFGTRYMPSFAHPNNGQDVQLEGALVKLDRCLLCKLSTAPCV
ncbi:hypothetical protein HaLaN_08218, partial [Haematococcus lacustris]